MPAGRRHIDVCSTLYAQHSAGCVNRSGSLQRSTYEVRTTSTVRNALHSACSRSQLETAAPNAKSLCIEICRFSAAGVRSFCERLLTGNLYRVRYSTGGRQNDATVNRPIALVLLTYDVDGVERRRSALARIETSSGNRLDSMGAAYVEVMRRDDVARK